MSQNRTTIEINGKRYDTLTGRVVGEQEATNRPVPVGLHLDGIRRPTKTPQPAAQTNNRPRPVRVAVTTGTPKTASAARRTPGTTPARHHKPAHAVHAKTQRSATLMRKAVAKPVDHKAASSAHSTRAASGHQPHHAVKADKHEPSPARLQRAQSISRSRLVSKFGQIGESPVVRKVEHLPVQPAPTPVSAASFTPPSRSSTYQTGGAHAKPAVSHHVTPLARESLLDRGVQNAATHKASPYHKPGRRQKVARKLGIHPSLVNIGAASLVGLLLVGFLIYQNSANIAMRVARSKSGVAASVPGFLPASFAMQAPIQYSPGAVTLTFSSNNDANRKFTLTQQESAWNSDALFANMFGATNRPYQVHSHNGQTIYTFGEGDATWVSGGIWYQIEGGAELGNEQLLRIAASL